MSRKWEECLSRDVDLYSGLKPSHEFCMHSTHLSHGFPLPRSHLLHKMIINWCNNQKLRYWGNPLDPLSKVITFFLLGDWKHVENNFCLKGNALSRLQLEGRLTMQFAVNEAATGIDKIFHCCLKLSLYDTADNIRKASSSVICSQTGDCQRNYCFSTGSYVRI